jgi:dihydroneopterin aldolase
MDIVYLHDLKIDCVLGIWEWERRTTQTVTIDLDLGADVRQAATSDRIEDTVNYKAIAKRLIAFVGESQFGLVETLAEKIAEIVLEEFPVRWVRVRVNKRGAIRGASDVGVIVERGEKL